MWNTNDLYDELEEQLAVMPPMYHNYGGKRCFRGEVETVRCFEDNSRVKEAMASPGKGRVLVVDGGGSLHCALIGDLIAESAINHGWAGILVHGCCRDVHELQRMNFGVRALASTPRKSVRKGIGEVGIELNIDGILIKPGMWLYADETGVVITPGKIDL
jgi:regulator of ribonuclease activity A